MSRRAPAVASRLSPALAAYLRRRLPLNPHKRLRPYSTTISSPDDDLRGLTDPSDQATPQELPVSAKDFTFLHKSAAVPAGPTPGEPSNDAISIAAAIKHCSNIFNTETQNTIRRFRGNLSQSLVIEVLRLVKSPEPAVAFFIWAGRQIGYSHTGPTYDALIDTMGFDRNAKVSESLLRDISDDDREVLDKLLNVLVRKCCRNGLWNEALEELGRMKDLGCKPSKATYNALVRVFLSAGRLDSAFLIHREMLDGGFGMDQTTMGCFANALCKAGRWIEAINIVEKEDYKLDTVLCTHMISGLLEASLFEEAMSFLHRMRANSCVPNVVTYRTLLLGFLKKKELGWCKRIINMMITEGFNPNPSLFNSLLHAYCCTGDYSYAYKLLKKMEACGCRLGYVPYNIFIGGICGNEAPPDSKSLDLAERAYGDMFDAGVVLNKVNIGNFAKCLCGAEKFDKAFKVIKEMMSKGFVPDASTYTKVIDFLCHAHKVEEAFLLFEEMKMSGVTPDVYTYTILIDNFCKAGLIQQARNWFDEMVCKDCAPNVVTYTALIHAYLKAKCLSEANDIFDIMLNSGCRPNIVTYGA